uniref:ATPase AAA-type core domain-containing protein n=1 Tax=Glossina brevipalpis TaxID=37001 RepID=A0A1A9W3L8_9MUSC
MEAPEDEDDGAVLVLDNQRKGKCALMPVLTKLILETLPTEYDGRMKAMELDERPTEQYSDIGIQRSKFYYMVLRNGQIMLARACANACVRKRNQPSLACPQLVQMSIGDGAKLAKEKAPAIIFIDELDAIGTKRFDFEKAGDPEVQRPMNSPGCMRRTWVALRCSATQVTHEDFIDAIMEVQAKKKANFNYYA